MPSRTESTLRELLARRTEYFYRHAMTDLDAALAAGLFDGDFRLENPLPSSLPFGGVYEGIPALRRYIGELSTHLRMEAFRVTSILVDADIAVVVGTERSTFVATGGRYEMEWVHLLQFTADGRYASLREYNDTAALLAAWEGGACAS